MPKLNMDKVPKQCNDRGRSFSWHDGKRVYHGVAGTPEANRNYNRFIHKLTEEPTLALPDVGTNIRTIGGTDVLVAERNRQKLPMTTPKRFFGTTIRQSNSRTVMVQKKTSCLRGALFSTSITATAITRRIGLPLMQSQAA